MAVVDQNPRPVSLLAVIGGLLVTLIIGVPVTPIATLLGMATFDESHSKLLGLLVAVGAPAVVYAGFWLLVRRYAADFARGIVIGACVLLLISGACGIALVGEHLRFQ